VSQYKALKEIAWKCNMDLPRLGLVKMTFGNASAIDRTRGIVAIKPSGIAYGDLRPDDIVIVDLHNTVIEGRLQPSSDTQTHTLLYRSFPAIGGVVHTHSTYAVAWAQAVRPIPILGTTHADNLAADIPCTRAMTDTMIAGDYEEGTGMQILKTFARRSYQEIPMVLVASHGPFAWGETPEKAVYNAAMLEELATMAYLTLQIRPGTPALKQGLIDKHFKRKHGPDAYYGQSGPKKGGRQR
jgi:L-ribulose-5-phosphate 4-epimerase